MKLTNEQKSDILNLVINKVRDISDIQYQKRVWIRGEGPEWDDFDETVCLFLHEGNGVLEKYKDFDLTEIQYQILKKFRNAFRDFAQENHSEPEFIDTPEWENITKMAKEVLETFHYTEKKKIK